MTLNQLKYAIAISKENSLNDAAKKLFISQPSLTGAMHALEGELGFDIFIRSKNGITLTTKGTEFIGYARAVIEQYDILDAKYVSKTNIKKHFSVSMQHYVFAVHAFINVVKEYDNGKYTFAVHETRTDEVLSNVRSLDSEVGVVAFSKTNEKVMRKLFREYQLEFTPLITRETFVYVWKDHPMAKAEELSLEDLKDYPCISFDQSSENDFYLTEEALGDYEFDKLIKTNDRATSAELMAAMNGYSIGTGVMTDSLALKRDVVTIKLKEEDPLTIGYIVRANHKLSEIGQRYIDELLKYKE